MGEFVPGYEASAWQGIGTPKNTPPEIINKLNNGINAGPADPRIRAWIAELGGTELTGSPGDFGKLIADETEKWAKVVSFPARSLTEAMPWLQLYSPSSTPRFAPLIP